MSFKTEGLPETIRVGGFTMRLETENVHAAASNARYGNFSSLEQVIRIQAEFASPEKAVDTLLHEVLHAIYWVYGVEDEDKEERVVSTMGSGLMDVLRGSPELRRWIDKALTG